MVNAEKEKEERCRDCAYPVEVDGKWGCDDCQRDIHNIPDEQCSAEQNF